MKCGYKIAWRWSDICFAFLVCLILNFKIFGAFEGSIAQNIVEQKELRGGLAKPKVQLIPFETICLILHA
jgi:hypothetical protein